MPYSFLIDPSSCTAWVRASGPMNLEESLAAPVELSAHPEFDSDFGVIVDLRDLEYHPRAGDVVEVAHNLVRLRSLFRHRVGVIVRRQHAVAAELGAAIANAGGFPLRVFRSTEEARSWVTEKDAYKNLA